MAKTKTLLVGALLLAAASTARAQPTAKMTSEQIACELAADCVAEEASADPNATAATRGFSISRHPAAGAANQPAKLVPRPAVPARGPLAPRPAGRSNLAINFVSGSAVLSESGRDLAQTFLGALRLPKLAGKSFMIVGHTDAVGSRDYNLSLSLRRAQALVDYLVQQGASRSQFEVRGYGFDRPLPGKSRTAAANRRVEVVTRN
jgi:outer membrane protein OmpA-like peptidoglycan-associated protein